MDISLMKANELVGQRMMLGFEGIELNGDLKHLIDEYKVGGLILFTYNIQNPNQLKRLCSSIQTYAVSRGLPPLLISIDQEGGRVARLKKPFSEFPGNPQVKSLKDARDFADTAALELSEMGISMNMAPVLDLAPKNIQSIVKGRSFGHDPKHAAKMGAKVIERFQHHHVMAVAKHFPGIGRTTLDSHDDLPHLDVDQSDLESYDLIPFYEAIRHDVAGIMLSHIRYNSIDPIWPASMSRKIATGLLRKKLGFENLIITDDLDMGAIKKHYEMNQVIGRILEADVDVVLICHKGPDIEIAYQTIYDRITKSQEMKNRCRISVKRMLKLKKKYLADLIP